MRRRYLCDILRQMRYFARSTWSNPEPDDYMLQIVDDRHMVFSERANTDTELIKGARAAGVPIHGQHWADYFTPANALEKRMHDDVLTLSKIVAHLVTEKDLKHMGYSHHEANRILKDAVYVSEPKDDAP